VDKQRLLELAGIQEARYAGGKWVVLELDRYNAGDSHANMVGGKTPIDALEQLFISQGYNNKTSNASWARDRAEHLGDMLHKSSKSDMPFYAADDEEVSYIIFPL